MKEDIKILKNKIELLKIPKSEKNEVVKILNKIEKKALKIDFKTKMLKENAIASKTLFNNIIIEIEKKNKIIQEINEELKTTEEELRENNEELIILNEHVKKQKQIIEEKELRLQNIIENQGEGFAIMDFDENFVFTNSKTCEIFNVKKNKLAGRNLSEFLDEKELIEIKEQTKKKKQNIRSNYELKIKLEDNSEKHLLITSAPDYNEKGEIIGIIGNLRDITNRKEEQKRLNLLNIELKKSEEKYRVLFEKSNDAILLIENKKFIDCNMAAVKLFGFSNKNELINTHPADISPDYQHYKKSYLEAEKMMIVAYKKGVNKFEWIHKQANNKTFPAEVWLTVIPYKNRQALHTVVRDLTKRKNNEQILNLQRKKIELAHKNITDSISYANKIQQALLPGGKVFEESFSEYFILDKPRDIVSGDFYWAKSIKFLKTNDTGIAFAVADCTGHGVPGSLLSMLGISFLNEIVKANAFEDGGFVLNYLREKIKNILGQTGKFHEPKDGMDIAFCTLNKNTLELMYAGANNSLYIIRKNNKTKSKTEKLISNLKKNTKIKIHNYIKENKISLIEKKTNTKNHYIIELKPDRQPIGIYLIEKSFTAHKIKVEKGDIIFAFSDGYIDQFNDIDKDKFNYKRFRNLLLSIADKPLEKQKQIMENTYINWKGNMEQIDDVLILCVKV